jgi:hypothetical protein
MKTIPVLCSAALLVVLAGCGGGASASGGDAGTNQPQADQFATAVRSIVAASSEDTQPQSVDATDITTTEDKDAAPIS